MRGLTLFLALIPSLAVADWTITWYSDEGCKNGIGHIAQKDGTKDGGSFDSGVGSFIAEWDDGADIFVVSADGGQAGGLPSHDMSGKCKKKGDISGWGFEPK
ncbi:hypothetical protein NUU61_004283 [Penicillium alfredii]|uniref:Uncharacterized protein n=1 Tax=Penicillium alfredii TaxID=1506179 RepID=A0A9W9KDQ4_9EURO|nr:uncharacterized protein NUU61_004283 [Penicillium alfredii]KAJ5102061.1 hypothetical protein NUU61_004283 [Penicillium alfredii]